MDRIYVARCGFGSNFDTPCTLYCDERELVLNVFKTQLILFKSTAKRIPADIGIQLDGCTIKPVPVVKLLGVYLNHHFTMCDHIEKMVSKCHGLIGTLRKAASFLPPELSCITYVALIRSHWMAVQSNRFQWLNSWGST